MQMQLMNIHKDGFLQNGRHNSYQSYRYDSFTCAQQTAELLELYARLTSSLLLPTQAHNSSHPYMVTLRLVWFPRYMDWECRTKVYNK